MDPNHLSGDMARMRLAQGAQPYQPFTKKVGPVVPPKPKKQNQTQAQVPAVPKSTSTKAQDPSFSTVLHGSPSRAPEQPAPIYTNLMPSRGANYTDPSIYSNISNYSNIANYANSSNYSNYSNASNYSELDNLHSARSLSYSPYPPEDDLPPPPPPEPPSYPPSMGKEDNFPPPPPSPVSSSYSELRRATSGAAVPQSHNRPYSPYAPPSQESVYERISPRPPSSSSNISTTKKEAEVDALTNLLVQSMDSSRDPDFFGICDRCGDKVVGEGSGCTAMDRVYHIHCFTCSVCHCQLQGKPFYAVDGKPYCEEDYLNTLEKCCVCTKPIVDRVLRATGKPYHPGCFTCVVCGKSLDGIPFTVDASNMIHCIEDFHGKFAPRCSVCKQPIMPDKGKGETIRVVALDRSFHVHCYKCEDCGLVLSSEAEGKGCYPLDGHVLCKSCNARRVQLLTNLPEK